MTNIYENALQAQSACNLSGLVHSLSRDIDTIWKEAREQGEGTDFVNQHPVVRLYLEQMAFLNQAGSLDFDSYQQAHHICEERASNQTEIKQ